MEIGLNYARIIVYKNLIDYIDTHHAIHADKHKVFSMEVIDTLVQKIQDYVMESDEIDLKFTSTDTDSDEKIKETIEKYFHIDDEFMIVNSKDPFIMSTFIYLYRIKAAANSELTEHLFFTAAVNELFRNNFNIIESCIDANERYIDIYTQKLLDYYEEYSRICREAYYNGRNIRSVKSKLREIADKKNPLLKALCIDDNFFRKIVRRGKTSQVFLNEDFYITKLKKDIIEYRILHDSIHDRPDDVTSDDLILYFNVIASSHYYANMINLIESGVLDDFPKEMNYIMSQVVLEDAICENIFFGRAQDISLSRDKKDKCHEFPKSMIYELYEVPINNNIKSVMGTTDEDYINNNQILASNMCSILFLKAIASLDPELEDRINSLIRNSVHYNGEDKRTSSILIQNFMNLEYICQSEIEKIKSKRKDND